MPRPGKLRIQTTDRFIVPGEHPEHQIERMRRFARLVRTKNRFYKLPCFIARAIYRSVQTTGAFPARRLRPFSFRKPKGIHPKDFCNLR